MHTDSFHISASPLSKAKLSLYASLAQRKMRKRHGLFIVEGEKSVSDLLDAFHPVAIIIQENHLPGFDVNKVPVYTATASDMKKLSNLTTPSSVIGVFEIPVSGNEDCCVDRDELYMVLDDVQDPGNLGTIIRTCHWFGIRRIFASHGTADLYNPKVIQATMGSAGHVQVVYCDLPALIRDNPDMPVYGTLLEGKNIFKADLSRRGFIVMGNEGNGISGNVINLITHPLNIPPTNPDHGESLNVAIAAGITLAMFRR